MDCNGRVLLIELPQTNQHLVHLFGTWCTCSAETLFFWKETCVFICGVFCGGLLQLQYPIRRVNINSYSTHPHPSPSRLRLLLYLHDE